MLFCQIDHSRTGKTCSRECYLIHLSNRTKGKCGGYRIGSGRSKSGYYRGHYCGSSYELCWVIYQLDHGLEFSRFDGCLEENGLRYFPDFLQNGKIVEIKGFEDQDKVEAKSDLAKRQGYEIAVLRKEDLKKEFDWVKKNYQFKDISELYDDHSPRFTYTCSFCTDIFSAQKSKKTEKFFCSRRCSLLGNRQISGRNQHSPK